MLGGGVRVVRGCWSYRWALFSGGTHLHYLYNYNIRKARIVTNRRLRYMRCWTTKLRDDDPGDRRELDTGLLTVCDLTLVWGDSGNMLPKHTTSKIVPLLMRHGNGYRGRLAKEIRAKERILIIVVDGL